MYEDPDGLAAAEYHVFPQSIWRGLDSLLQDVKQLFDQAVVKPVNKHGYSKQHAAYNRIARKAWDKFCEKAGSDLKNMTRDVAKGFLDYLKSNPEDGRFNEQIQSGEPLTMPDETAPLPEIEPIAPVEPLVEPPIVEPVVVEPIFLL